MRFTRNHPLRIYILAIAVALILTDTAAHAAQTSAARTSSPDLVVEYFGPERGYTVKGADVVMVCVVRNVGTSPLPDKTVRLHCYAIDGLDYTSGDTVPVVPALARNQAISYRWRLAQTSSGKRLVAAVMIESAQSIEAVPARDSGAVKGPDAAPSTDDTGHSGLPRATVCVIPIVPFDLHLGSRGVQKDGAPEADITGNDAWLSNDRVCIRAVLSDCDTPIVLMGARSGLDWSPVATATSLCTVNSAEMGQRPWTQTFHWRDSKVGADKTSAGLTLTGVAGKVWRVQIEFQTSKETSAIRGVLRLTALRTARLYEVSIPTLIPEEDPRATPLRADGTPIPVISDDPVFPNENHVAAERRSGVTFGVSWPSSQSEGQWNAAPYGDAQTAPILGAGWTIPDGSVVLAGATVEFPFRLFALYPSDTIKDALRFLTP